MMFLCNFTFSPPSPILSKSQALCFCDHCYFFLSHAQPCHGRRCQTPLPHFALFKTVVSRVVKICLSLSSPSSFYHYPILPLYTLPSTRRRFCPIGGFFHFLVATFCFLVTSNPTPPCIISRSTRVGYFFVSSTSSSFRSSIRIGP